MAPSKVIQVDRIHFVEGIPGFNELKWFQLVQEEAESPLFSLVSLEDQQIGFWLIDPFVFFKDYEFTLKDSHKKILDIHENTSIAVLNIVTVRSVGVTTVNLKAPVVINMDNGKAKQVILEDERFEVRQPLLHHASNQDK